MRSHQRNETTHQRDPLPIQANSRRAYCPAGHRLNHRSTVCRSQLHASRKGRSRRVQLVFLRLLSRCLEVFEPQIPPDEFAKRLRLLEAYLTGLPPGFLTLPRTGPIALSVMSPCTRLLAQKAVKFTPLVKSLTQVPIRYQQELSV